MISVGFRKQLQAPASLCWREIIAYSLFVEKRRFADALPTHILYVSCTLQLQQTNGETRPLWGRTKMQITGASPLFLEDIEED